MARTCSQSACVIGARTMLIASFYLLRIVLPFVLASEFLGCERLLALVGLDDVNQVALDAGGAAVMAAGPHGQGLVTRQSNQHPLHLARGYIPNVRGGQLAAAGELLAIRRPSQREHRDGQAVQMAAQQTA